MLIATKKAVNTSTGEVHTKTTHFLLYTESTRTYNKNTILYNIFITIATQQFISRTITPHSISVCFSLRNTGAISSSRQGFD